MQITALCACYLEVVLEKIGKTDPTTSNEITPSIDNVIAFQKY